MHKPTVTRERYRPLLVASPAAVSGPRPSRIAAGSRRLHAPDAPLVAPPGATRWPQAPGRVVPSRGVLVLNDPTRHTPDARPRTKHPPLDPALPAGAGGGRSRTGSTIRRQTSSPPTPPASPGGPRPPSGALPRRACFSSAGTPRGPQPPGAGIPGRAPRWRPCAGASSRTSGA
jgi:hypothetical protein